MMNSFRWSYVPKKPWSNPPNFQVASTCCPCLRQFLLQNHPLWGEAFCCPRSTDVFPMWMQDTPRRFILWVFLDNQSWTDRSLVVSTNPPFPKNVCSSKLDHESPRLRGGVKLPKKCLKLIWWKSTNFFQPETGQGASVAAPTQNWCFLFCLSGLPDPHTSIRHGSAPSKWHIFNPKVWPIWYAKQHHELWIVPKKIKKISVLNSSILDNLHIWRIYLANICYHRECLWRGNLCNLPNLWKNFGTRFHQVVQNSEHIHSLNLTVRPWK